MVDQFEPGYLLRSTFSNIAVLMNSFRRIPALRAASCILKNISKKKKAEAEK